MKFNRVILIGFISVLFLQHNISGQGTCGDVLTAKNLVVNGDFESPLTAADRSATGISSYEYNASGGPGYWTVVDAMSPFRSYAIPTLNGVPADHSEGTRQGKYMVIDIDASPSKLVWKQTVTVQPNTNYFFSTYISNINRRNVNPSQLAFAINNTNISGIFSPNPVASGAGNEEMEANADHSWLQFYVTWNSGSTSGPVTISIKNLLEVVTGNDLALDDITFSTSCKFISQLEKSHFPDRVSVCNGQPVLLDAGLTESGTFSWFKGTTFATAVKVADNKTYTIPANTFGKYYFCYTINNCARLDTMEIVNEPIKMDPIAKNPVKCGGEGSITISDVLPLKDYSVNYSVNNSPVNSTVQANSLGQLIIPVRKGNYTAVQVEANGCTSNSAAVDLNGPASPVLDLDGISYAAKSCASTWLLKLYGVRADLSYDVTITRNKITNHSFIQANSSSKPYLAIEDLQGGSYLFNVKDPETNCTSNELPLELRYSQTVSFQATVTDPAVQGGNGSILLSGLQPGKTYTLNYSYNKGPLTTVTRTTGTNGMLEIVGKAGEYKPLNVSDGFCMSSDTGILIKDPVIAGFSSFEDRSAEFCFYPNPTQGHLKFKMPSAANLSLRIYNSAGMFVEERAVLYTGGDETLDLSGLEVGMYSLQVSGLQREYRSKLLIIK